MSLKIKIDGVYDKGVLNLLDEIKVSDFSFDLRPKSFNFIQGYVLIDLLKETFRPWNRYYLHFENEKEFVAQKILKDVLNTIHSLSGEKNDVSNIYLEFSDGQSVDYYESFKTPYLIHLDERHRIAEFVNSHYLKIVNLPYTYLSHLKDSGKFGEFVKTFYQEMKKRIPSEVFEVSLSSNWNDDLFPSLFDYMSFSMMSYPINNQIESSYRIVNIELLKQYLKGKR